MEAKALITRQMVFSGTGVRSAGKRSKVERAKIEKAAVLSLTAAKFDRSADGIHPLYDGKRFHAIALRTQTVTTGLKSFFHGDADAFHRCARLMGDVDQSFQRSDVRKEIINDQQVVICMQILLGDSLSQLWV